MKQYEELAQFIHDMFVSNWGIDSPMAKDSGKVLAELNRLYVGIEQLIQALEPILANVPPTWECADHARAVIDQYKEIE